MIQCGEAPFLECSSKGDTRFSAFYARIRGRGNRSIEAIYQGAKRFMDGETNLCIRDAKGRPAVNQAEVTVLYARLWDEYFQENKATLLPAMRQYRGFQDRFGQPGHCCQAIEIYRLYRQHVLETTPADAISITHPEPNAP